MFRWNQRRSKQCRTKTHVNNTVERKTTPSHMSNWTVCEK